MTCQCSARKGMTGEQGHKTIKSAVACLLHSRGMPGFSQRGRCQSHPGQQLA